MAERHKCVERVEVPLEASIVCFKRPKCEQYTAADAILLFDAVKDSVIAVAKAFALVQPLG